MKRLLPVRMLLPVGMLVTTTALILHRFVHLTDSVYGFLMGVGIGVMLFALYKQQRIKQAS